MVSSFKDFFLKESPDRLAYPYSALWDQSYAATFGIIDNIIYYSLAEGASHQELCQGIINNAPNIVKTIGGSLASLKVELKLRVESVKRLSDLSDYGFRSEINDVTGRYFIDEKVISFWNKRNKIIPHIDLINQLITTVTPEVKYSDIKLEFADKFDTFLSYYQMMKPFDKPSADKDIKELMMKQHLDPNAKRKLGIKGFGGEKAEQVAQGQGFKNAAERTFRSVIGDSTIVPKITSPNSNIHASSFSQFLLEKKGTTSYGCLMAVLPEDSWKPFIKFGEKKIATKNLSKDGRENEPHVTVIYGFHEDVNLGELIKDISAKGPLDLTLGKISRFENGEFDVIKVDAFSKDIKRLHNKLSKDYGKKITTKFPEWHGHLTLAYVKPGSHPELDGNEHFEGQTFTIDKLIYSFPGMEPKITIPLS